MAAFRRAPYKFSAGPVIAVFATNASFLRVIANLDLIQDMIIAVSFKILLFRPVYDDESVMQNVTGSSCSVMNR